MGLLILGKKFYKKKNLTFTKKLFLKTYDYFLFKRTISDVDLSVNSKNRGANGKTEVAVNMDFF